ncbi:orotidine 5'-phosphate decarboxylase [Candidatus Daviesbacteria bacterium RIFCSPHIGHO2_02_FULL_39_12]|uniref:Orotidine-5'-phosphate decarboxylase n=2 Tax=Candidatus Daviesiibacteriota TaxID=1752718 RepID=A0A1F5J8T4_9BACT|nr:MAG: orotidine 5'-phosphate decarboxylase [Candidatus Daviesbacteria bacterium RIFCSPHIGHO2_02_FULL_39_12]OGE72285.1 MAG: orotidine 5'-phosphate decarboxylase [Candidatus Daviesbacteria bacterium RIFCSPLOWO2_02_FULL_38_15]OGI07126.1 MAG: orotidine 5'-phosphate decarboxylase [Candidatus Melainabacteria bacterium RIFCSPLOWO2_12_FULL_35_11]
MASFKDKLKVKWNENKFVCIGLDKGEFEFNKQIIDQTAQLICAYKLNSAFYEAEGLTGRTALEKTVKYIQNQYPDAVLIFDAKRADIDNSNRGYVKDIFDNLNFDAVTVHPYLGKEAMQPFLKRVDKGIIVLVKTSNPGAEEFQDLIVSSQNIPLYQYIASKVANEWNKNGNCAVVVGATYQKDLKIIRKIVSDMPILVPGIGAQNGALEETLKNGLDSNKQGLIISSSRGIIFAQNPKEATLKLHQKIVSSLRAIVLQSGRMK